LLLEVGRIVKPHGIRGEVIVELVTNRAERLDPGSVLSTDAGDFEVLRSSPHQNRWIVAFAGVADRNRAEELRGTVLRAEALEDEDDTLWVHELVGVRVYDVNGLFYGSVLEVEANPASDLLVLPQGLVPLTFVVDQPPGRVVIDPPEGLIEPRPPIEVVDYDPAWPARYDAEAARLREALGDVAVRIEHVGSTSVPGLAAKPVIDIQLSVASFEPEERFAAPLRRLGYEQYPDPATPEHRIFTLPKGGGPRQVNLHVCEVGSEWERRHPAFRDRLRGDPVARDEYAALKRRLALEHGNDVESYADAKGEFIRAHQ